MDYKPLIMKVFSFVLLLLCGILPLRAQQADSLRLEAARCKAAHRYEQACLLYQRLLQRYPGDLSLLSACAETQLLCGNEEAAAKLYRQVLQHDDCHLQACIFMGNYHFLRAEKTKKRLDEEYRQLPAPTRMQYARYRNALADLLATDYAQARAYLQRVLQQFPSAEAAETLKRIKTMEEEAERVP